MKTLGYFNGKYDEQENMVIPMNDRSSWFGDGVYDAGPSRNYKMFAVDDHVNRFFRNAEWLDIEMPMSKDNLKDLISELLKKMDDDSQFVYMQLTRAGGLRDHTYESNKGNLWITLKPAKVDVSEDPHCSAITTEDDRWFNNNIKTINLISAVRSSQKAIKAGAGEAILVRPNGIVTECAHSNVHILKNGTFITHPADNMILPGIARAHLIRMCGIKGVPVEERTFTEEELNAADEILITSSSKLCLRTTTLNGKPFGGHDMETYLKIRKGVVDEFLEETM